MAGTFLRGLNAAMRRNPFTAAVAFSTVKAGGADAFTQTVIEGRKELDKDRLSVFFVFGCVYQGTFQHFLWNVAFKRIWPGMSLGMNLCKLVATNLISDPLFFFPTFYVLREAFTAPKAAGNSSSIRSIVPTALRKYRDNCWRDWTTGWCVWIPGHYVTYFCMPLHLRVPWVASASFSYICILSYMRGNTTTTASAEVAAPATTAVLKKEVADVVNAAARGASRGAEAVLCPCVAVE